MRVKTDVDLREIINNKNEFQELAVLAAILELEKREITESDHSEIKEKIEIKLDKAKDKVNLFEIPGDIAGSIKKASIILFGTVLIGLLNWFLFDPYLEVEVGLNSRSISIFALSSGFATFISYMILTGRVWARTVFLVVFILGFLLSIKSLFFFLINVPLISVVSLLRIGLEVYALILLYNKESKDWYLKQKQISKSS